MCESYDKILENLYKNDINYENFNSGCTEKS